MHQLPIVALDTGECRYFDASGVAHACPDSQYNHKDNCCHRKAAVRAELNMFGNRADIFFASGVDYEPPQRAAERAA
jgi:hypothetical protein